MGVGALALPAQADTAVPRPDSFTSTFDVQATGAEVAGDTSGNSRASATFRLELNSDLNVICYTVTTRGVTPPYMSPARTSTHIHEAPAGAAGPPRIVFADPTSANNDDPRVSSECLQGPFTTGVTGDSGADTGAGFTVAELEADPAAYYVDIHTTQFPAGSVRGQLPAMAGPGTAGTQAQAAPPAQAPPSQDAPPVGGVAAGQGGLSGQGAVTPALAALAAALVALTAGLTGSAWARGRRRS